MLLAVGILGATVMPHVIWLHSALTQHRIVGADEEAKRRIYRFERIDVVIAMTIAGVINLSMLITAAAVFNARGLTGIDDLDEVFDGLGAAFTLARRHRVRHRAARLRPLVVVVGTLAGQVVMQGFIRRQIPLFLRRGITMVPALVVIALGVNASAALIVSQVVLSFGIPFALVPLVLFSRNRELMGGLVNARMTTIAALIVAALIISLNFVLLYLTFVG